MHTHRSQYHTENRDAELQYLHYQCWQDLTENIPKGNFTYDINTTDRELDDTGKYNNFENVIEN